MAQPRPSLLRVRRATFLWSLAIFILAAAPFLPAFRNGFINCDDDEYITANPHVSSGLTAANVRWAFTSFHSSNYHPLTWLSHMLDVQLFGLNPAGHHAVSIALHAAAAVVLFLLLFTTTRRLNASGIVALLFAVHPLRVESVAWAAERKDVLSVLLAFGTLLCYAGYVRNPTPHRFALTLVTFVLGLLAKPMLVTLPVLMLLMDLWPLRRLKGAVGRLLLEKVPFFALALASGIVTLIAQSRGGSVVAMDHRSIAARVLTAIAGYAWYLEKLFAPRDLTILYPQPATPPVGLIIAGVLVLTSFTAIALQQRRRRPYLLCGWAWYLVTLLPVIGLVQVGQQAVADRYSYLPLVGPVIALVWLARELVRFKPIGRTVERLALATVIGACCVLTFDQTRTWKDSISVFSRAYMRAGSSHLTNNNLASALIDAGEPDIALPVAAEAARRWPKNSDSYVNLAGAQFALGQLDDAIATLRHARDIDPTNPRIEIQLATACAKANRHADTEAAIRQAIRLIVNSPAAANPTPQTVAQLAGLYNDLGIAIAQQNRLPEATDCFHTALSLVPDHAGAKINLAHATQLAAH